MTPPTTHFDPTRALPNTAFRDQVWLDAELDNIWHDDWVFATTEDAIPNPGDQLPITIGRQPVLLIRNQEGKLGAVSNLCAHRGTLLVATATNGKRLQCPYHAWTYTDGGRLLSVPFSPKNEVDKSAHCLPSYRVETWHGLIFVSLNTAVEPLSTRFAAIDHVITGHDVDGLHHWSQQQQTEVWACNWKLAILNAMESYHLFQVHPETLEPYSPTKDAYYISGSARATATGGTSKGQDDYILVSLPPGFVGVFTNGSFIWQAVHPIDVGSCVVRTGGAFTSPPPERSSNILSKWITQGTTAAAALALPDFLPEDKAICERGQLGARGDYEPGQLLGVERIVADFGHYLNWRLNGVEPEIQPPKVASA